MERIEMTILNKRPEIARLNGVLEEFMESHDVPMKASFAIDLALDEILTNVICYAFAEEEQHEITVRVWLDEGLVGLEVEDDGKAFNPLEQEEVDTDASIEEREIGGLGIHLVRKMMDAVEYARAGEKNILTMKKKLEE